MAIYFSPTGPNEVSFPTRNLPNNIAKFIRNNNEGIETNNDQLLDPIDINDNREIEEIEISDFYEKYASDLNKFSHTTARKKLNKIKVYVIVKSKIIKGEEINFAVPIRCFDDLGNSVLELYKGLIASIFHVKAPPKKGMKYIEGRPGNRPFYLKHLLSTEPPFYVDNEFPLENLILPRRFDIEGNKLDLSEDSRLKDPSRLRAGDVVDQFGVHRTMVFFLSEYEYIESMLDNTFLLNTARYVTDIRYKPNDEGKREKSTIFSRFKEIDFKKEGFNAFSIASIISRVVGNTSALTDKNIIPVFSNLEDAQDLLITLLEEVNQPFQVRRKIERASTPQYYRSLEYLDDSFTYHNRYFFPNPESRIDKLKDLLRTYRFIKPRNIPAFSKDRYYHENRYQTKGPCFIEDPEPMDPSERISEAPPFVAKNFWREEDYWLFLRCYFPGQGEDYSWFESRDMSDTDKGLLQKSQDVKIISMGLADFLEFWNNPTQKNGQVLFIPSSKKLNKIKFPLSSKKSRDRLYDYQQKFRDSKKHNTENYIYEIKVSSD